MLIPALPIAIAAVLAALLVYALLTFGTALVSIIPTSGFPGIGFVHNAVKYGVTTASNAVDYLLAPLMINAVNLVLAPVYMFERLIGAIESALAEAATTISWMLGTVIPGLYDNLQSLIWSSVKTLDAYIAAGLAHASTLIAVFYAKSLAYVDAKIAAVLTHVQQEVAAGVTAATTTAVQAATVIATDVDHAAASAITATWPDVIAGVQGAEGAIEGGLDDILAGLKGIDLTLPKDLAGVTAFTGALAIPMLRYLEQCGIPNCRNLSQLGRDLQALLNLVGDAAFLALIVGLISDPHGTAETLDNLLTPLADDTIGAAKTLLGVG